MRQPALSASAFTLLALACAPAPKETPNPGPTDLGPSNCGSPPSADAGVTSALVQGNSALALDLLGQLTPAAAGQNLFFSPYSVSTALAMTYAGANGQTAQQLAQVLHFPTDAADLAPAVGALACELQADGAAADGGQLDIANAIFGQQGATFEQPFLTLLSTDCGAPLQQVDFAGAPDTARQTLNGWVSDHTGGKIPQVLAPGSVTKDMKLVLANALYFEGFWPTQFEPSGTQPAPFQVSATQTVQAPMMTSWVLHVSYAKTATFAALELPFTAVGVAFDILLPDAVDGLPALEAGLTPATLATALAALAPTSQIAVEIPKLQLDTKLDLVPTFEALGLTLPFGTSADFSGIDGEQDLSISLLRHEAVLDVDEAGATAAAATVVGLAGSAAPVQPPTSFVANHPFLILIRDLPTGSLLFVGQVTNPTQS